MYLSYIVGPEATVLTGPVKVLTNASGSVTITAYTNIMGNPVPTSTWTRDGNNIVTGGRFNIDTSGQLIISSVISSDAGLYINTLSNSVNSINNTIELIVVGKL